MNEVINPAPAHIKALLAFSVISLLMAWIEQISVIITLFNQEAG
jgi:hypothetical protein